MGKQLVEKYVCDRCPRQWFDDPSDEEDTGVPDLKVEFHGKDGEVYDFEFETLCSSCQKTVENHVKAIGKMLNHNSPKRGAKKEEPGAPQEAVTPRGETSSSDGGTRQTTPSPSS